MATYSSGSTPTVPKDWECPPAGAPEDKLLGWMRDAVAQGKNFLKAQASYSQVQAFTQIIAGLETVDPKNSDKLSRVKYNKSKRVVRELVGGLSNLRPISTYRTENSDYQHQAEILNRLYLSWYHMSGAGRDIRECIQWAAGGKGWISPLWSPDVPWSNKGDLKLFVYGPNDVLPVQIGKDNDIQKAYAVTLCVETPLFQARTKYPQFADKIKRDRSFASWLKAGVQAVQRFASPALNAMDKEKQKSSGSGSFPTVDIYYTYVLDGTINDTGHTIPMGRPGSSWYYEVPSTGSDIPTGIKDPKTGADQYRKAMAEDCRLYPLRRMIISTNDCVLNPGMEEQTNVFWHGKVPLIPMQLDDWPWSFWGMPVTQDTAPLEKSLVNTLRAMDDSANVRLNPPLKYGGNIPKTLMDTMNMRVPDQTYKVEGMKGDNYIEPILPVNFYDAPAWMGNHLTWLDNAIDYLSAVKDIQALLKAKQIPSSESIEKLQELMGPVLGDMGMNVESAVQELGGQMKSNFFQFYPLARRMQILGENGTDDQDWDYDPATLVPSHMPGESGFDEWKGYAKKGSFTAPPKIAAQPSNFNGLQRARWHMNNFHFYVTPNSLLQMSQVTKKMMLLQLRRTGFPISMWTIAEQFDIPNFGKVPEGVDTEWDKFAEEQRMMARLKAVIAEEVGQDLQGQPGPKGGQRGTGGRAPSGNAAPQNKSRPDGSSTIQESR
jgi:hypothetical protein